MKIFVVKISLYTAIFLLFVGVLFLSVRYFSKFNIDNKKSMLLVGHSHSECAFNDSLITELCNYSASGESYFYTFYKTKKIIEQNPSIKTVFIEFSNNQIEKYMDSWIWGDIYISHKLPYYAPFLEKNDYSLFFKNNREAFLNSLSSVLQRNIESVAKGFRSSFGGGYLYLVRDKTDSLLIALNNEKNIYTCDSVNKELSETNIAYLSKLIKLCKDNNIKPYLIRSPLHEKWNDYKNEQIFQMILSTRFVGIELLDFSKFPLQNSEFGDLEHLNYRGARKFSIWFNQLIDDGLLERADKQNFINERLEEEK